MAKESGIEQHAVRLMNEYGVRWPLWGKPNGYEYQVGDLSLSPSLTRDIQAWTSGFLEHFDENRGWPTSTQAEAHFDEGHRLAAYLQGELGEGYRVTLDLWETGSAK